MKFKKVETMFVSLIIYMFAVMVTLVQASFYPWCFSAENWEAGRT